MVVVIVILRAKLARIVALTTQGLYQVGALFPDIRVSTTTAFIHMSYQSSSFFCLPNQNCSYSEQGKKPMVTTLFFSLQTFPVSGLPCCLVALIRLPNGMFFYLMKKAWLEKFDVLGGMQTSFHPGVSRYKYQ